MDDPKTKLAKLVGNKTAARLSAGNLTKKRKWHKDADVRYFPRDKEMFDDLDLIAEQYVFDTFGPDQPLLTNEDKVVTMGSCFAERLRTWLREHDRNAEYINVPEGLNNSFAVRQWLEWVLTGDRSSDAYWYDEDAVEGAKLYQPTEEHEYILEHMKKTKAVVITLGLGEVWRDKQTNQVFWRGIPEVNYDPTRHVCEPSSVDENVENIERIVSLIKTHAGEDTVVIFTLSPVPLNATFTKRPTIVSDCVSKSILRVALDVFFRKNTTQDVYYWPSFEMVRWVGAHTDMPTLYEDETPRHVNKNIVHIIISNFVKKFFKES